MLFNLRVKLYKNSLDKIWGHRDLNPDPGISLVSALQSIIIGMPQCAHFLQRQLESQMMPGYTITPSCAF